MVPKRKIQRGQNDDRRRVPDRRNGYDRRLNNHQAVVDDNMILNTKEACL